jgi:hypothetical protein
MKGYITANDQLFADMYRAAHVDGDTKKGQQVMAALCAFMQEPKSVTRKIQAFMQQQRKIQAVGASSDFDELLSNAFNVTTAMDYFDMFYEDAFREVTLGTNQDHWDVYTVTKALTFYKVPEGGRVKLDTLYGKRIAAYVDYYGGGLGFTDRMIRYRHIAAMVDIAAQFRNAFWKNKADNHYALLATAGAVNETTFDTSAYGDVAAAAIHTILWNTIKTINTAASALVERNKNKGYFTSPDVKLIMYARKQDQGQLSAAFAATGTSPQPANENLKVEWNIELKYTLNDNITIGKPILVLPGNKLQRADDMQPTTFVAPQDPLTLNQVQAVWAIYGAIIADTDQVGQVDLA